MYGQWPGNAALQSLFQSLLCSKLSGRGLPERHAAACGIELGSCCTGKRLGQRVGRAWSNAYLEIKFRRKKNWNNWVDGFCTVSSPRRANATRVPPPRARMGCAGYDLRHARTESDIELECELDGVCAGSERVSVGGAWWFKCKRDGRKESK